jgi:hypothetical protein
MHNEELPDLYSSSSINRITKLRRMRWAGHVARIGGREQNSYRLVVGKPEGKRPLRRPRCRWVDYCHGSWRCGMGWCAPDCSGSG